MNTMVPGKIFENKLKKHSLYLILNQVQKGAFRSILEMLNIIWLNETLLSGPFRQHTMTILFCQITSYYPIVTSYTPFFQKNVP